MQLRTISEFINAFHSFEEENSVYSLYDHHQRPLWDLIRYRIQFQLINEYGILPFRPNSTRTFIANLRSIASLSRQILRLLKDMFFILTSDMRSVHSLCVSNRVIGYIEDQCALGSLEHNLLLVNKTGAPNGDYLAIKYQSIKLIVRLASPFLRLPDSVEKQVSFLSDKIVSTFSCKGDVLNIIRTKLREEDASRYIWRFILSRANKLEKIIYVNDDSLKSLVFEARFKGIKTEEVQHAYMGKEHIAFSYPSLKHTIPTLPDRVIINRDTLDINYPVERVVLNKPIQSLPLLLRDIDVCIGSSPFFTKEVIAMIQILSQQNLRLAIKLHPSDSRTTGEVFRQSCGSKSLTIYDENDNLCRIARRSKVFIPANPASTAAFEAADMGSSVLIVHYDGFKKTTVADSVATAHVYDIGSLRNLQISSLFHPQPDPPS